MAVAVTAEGDGGTAAAAAQSVTLPGTAATSAILIFLGAQSSSVTWTQTSGTTGWTELYDSNGHSAWWKEVTAGESNPSFDASATDNLTYNVYRMTGYATSVTPDVSTVDTGGTDELLWEQVSVSSPPRSGEAFAAVSFGDGRREISVPPAGFGNVVSSDQIGTGGNSTRLESVRAPQSGVSTVGPLDGTATGNVAWRTAAVFVRDTSGSSLTIVPDAVTVTITAGTVAVDPSESTTKIVHSMRLSTTSAGTLDEVITSDVRDFGLRTDRGQDTAQWLPSMIVGNLEVTVTNSTFKYHPSNSGSPLFGNILPGRFAQLNAVYAGAPYELASGYLQALRVNRHPSTQTVDVSFMDRLHVLRSETVSTALYFGITTDAAIRHVLTAAGIDVATGYVADVGSTVLPIWWVERQTAWDAILHLLALEGPPATVYVDTDGIIRFRNRHWYQDDSLATWRDTGTEPTYRVAATYDQGWENVINDVNVTYVPRTQQDRQVVWSFGRQLTVLANESDTIIAEFSDPVENPSVAFDFYEAKAVVSTVFNAQSAEITVTAGSSNGILRNLRVIGAPWAPLKPRNSRKQDATSISEHGQRTQQIESQYLDRRTALSLARIYRNYWKDPRALMEIPVSNGDSTRITQMLTRDFGDRVTVIDAAAGVNDPFHIERIEHDVTQAGKQHVTTFTVREAASFNVDPDEVFILGSGQLGTNKLGL